MGRDGTETGPDHAAYSLLELYTEDVERGVCAEDEGISLSTRSYYNRVRLLSSSLAANIDSKSTSVSIPASVLF